MSEENVAEGEPIEKGYKGQASKDMASVTGYFDESRELDSQKIQSGLDMIFQKHLKLKEAKLEKEKELNKIVLSRENVEWIMRELDVSKGQAEKMLKQSSGDLKACVASWLNA